MNQEVVFLRNKVKETLSQSVKELKRFCDIPSISAQKKMIPETVQHVVSVVEGIGGTAKILDECEGGNPVVYVLFEAGAGGNPNKTILFYNHYDVQPPEPVDEWDTPPFDLTEVDGKLFGRGVADNKGDLMARLTAIKILKELDGGLPCNVKFLLEGEEEIGSPNLSFYLKEYGDLFKADACIWEHADKDDKDRVSLMAGVKGMAYFELTCESADMDLHSKVGATVENAAWRLTHALSSMKNNQHEIKVEGFFDGIIPPTDLELEYVKKIPFDEQSIVELYGLKQPLITSYSGQDPRVATIFNPTMTICGLESGYYGEGSKTVLPRKALAKLDCRLVPGQDPEHILECINRHLTKNGYSDVKTKLLNGVKAYRSDLSHPFVSLMVRTAQDVYDTEVVLSPNNAGTGPMSDFGHNLQLPIVSTGVGWANSRLHAPNESIRLKDYEEGIAHVAYLIKEFAKEE
ncbi:M20/M25/M40 family metallo-hydrolase [Cytobacillus sp. S13-E01]|uniref:M20/M25/M40 family metallo-hydrolase n=1 Tax=Cytobacillus sp. S13-E01 TaxID=3031326 RepID=UPI0023D85C70|nr:M20/M25/M40 family metallo-hydrolase [Cytobacillus sp. S13-E01]MDF0725491.1 M20/M25/M40 family metallo-hydrolase [Cytobacillus sp. S13-E01]